MTGSPAPRVSSKFPSKVLAFILLSCLVARLTSCSPARHHGRASVGHEDGSEGRRRSSSRTKSGWTWGCPRGHYLDRADRLCRPCSACPLNHIIRRPCGGEEDTRCGPFVEFDRFQQQQPGAGTGSETGKERRRGAPEEGSVKGETLVLVPPPRRRHQAKTRHHTLDAGQVTPELTSVEVTEDLSQWRALAIALLIVVCFISCCLIVLVLYLCFLHRRPHTHKCFVSEPEPLGRYQPIDPEPRYVDSFVIPRHNPMTSHQLPSHQVYPGSTRMLPFPSGGVEAKFSDSVSAELDQYIYLKCPPATVTAV